MRTIARAWCDDAGQSGLTLALALMIFAIPLAAGLFDYGVLVSDRRDAQNDVDRAALAGSLGLTLTPGDDGWPAALDAARSWLQRNGVDPDASGVAIAPVPATGCYEALSSAVVTAYEDVTVGITVTVDRPVASVFGSALGLRAGATATACAGVPVEHYGIFPLVVSREGLIGTCFDSTGNPVPGADCKVRVENTSGLVGALTVEYDPAGDVDCTSTGSGASDLESNLEFGVQGWCRVGQQVTAKTGETLNKTFDGMKARLSHEGSCDAAYAAAGGTQGALAADWDQLRAYLASVSGYTLPSWPVSDNRGPIPGLADGIDDFYEVWPLPASGPPASRLEPRPCPGYDAQTNSPRNIVLIIVPDALDTSGGPGQKYTILQFARMYLDGCTRTTGNGSNVTSEFRRDCSWPSLGSGRLTINARYVDQVSMSGAALGLSELLIGDLEVFLKR